MGIETKIKELLQSEGFKISLFSYKEEYKSQFSQILNSNEKHELIEFNLFASRPVENSSKDSVGESIHKWVSDLKETGDKPERIID